MPAEISEKFIQRCIELASENVAKGGGPFSCLVLREGEILCEAGNRVTVSFDPTAHAEICAIRMACEKLKTFQLTDCVLLASCEPCPMCLGAIYWARPKRVYFLADRYAAAKAQFDDEFIYEEIRQECGARKIPFTQIVHPSSQKPFDTWLAHLNRTSY